MYTTDDKKKNRISAIFGSKKSREDMDGRPSLSPAPGANGNSVDSAYASSDPPSQHTASTRTSPEFRHANMVSIENNGQISGVDGSRHLQLNQNTGEVLDEDTGEVVTTVTTTTTTTTTTVRKGGAAGEKKGTTVQVETRPSHPTVSSQQQPAAHTHLAEAPGDGPSARIIPDAAPTHLRNRSPVPPALQIGRQQPATEPAPPTRNPNRKSREYAPAPNGPPSPVTPGAQGRHNFSYPARMGTKSTENLPQMPQEQQSHYSPPQVPPMEPLQQQQSSPPGVQGRSSGGAFENLKAAAVGLHGVGETLRGTLNSEVDNRLSRRNPDKAAAVNAKNRADIERGQQEMARLRERNGLAPTIRRPGELSGVGSGSMPPQQQQDLSGAAMQQQRQSYTVSPISQHAPQLPPMQVGGGAGSHIGGGGGAGAGAGGSSKWDAPGTWGSGRVSEMKGPRAQTNEVHPALRGQGQGQLPLQSQQSQQQPQQPPSYGAPPPPPPSYPSSNGGAPGMHQPQQQQQQQRMDDSSRHPNGGGGGGGARIPGLVQQGPGANRPADSASGNGLIGSGTGMPNANPAANVQHLSHVQGHSGGQEPEEERRGGLKRLFKRKGVGAA
ncbi:hypothetical protein B0A55_02280 [Friedmanniomyces simplex]|uniref:Uncharacterized protein n=1 Tax=Friedmanniomyces simplex TaxID=329884 RepID=A0A4U0Y0J1_9PEZI|nr:hypothetical protein B0A55_02280 [Friedmanniomyces simplex]